MLRQRDLTGESLARSLLKYMENRSALTKMGRQAREISKTNAAEVIVDQILEMLKVSKMN